MRFRHRDVPGSGGVDLVALETGGAGTRVVIAAAPGIDPRVWDPLLAHLDGHAVARSWVYRGLSPSGRPAAAAELRSIRVHVEDLRAVIASEGWEMAHFVGWCLGTRVLLALYELEPERFSSLAILSPSLSPPAQWSTVTSADKTFLRLMERASLDTRIASVLARRIAAAPYIPSGPGSIAKQPEIGLALGGLSDAEDVRNCLEIQLGLIDWRAMPVLSRVEVPVLVIAGAEDEATPPEFAARAGRAPREGWSAIVPGCGHFPFLEAPAATARLLTGLWGGERIPAHGFETL